MTNTNAYRDCMKKIAKSKRQLEKALKKGDSSAIDFWTIAIKRDRRNAIYYRERAFKAHVMNSKA